MKIPRSEKCPIAGRKSLNSKNPQYSGWKSPDLMMPKTRDINPRNEKISNIRDENSQI